MNKNPVLCFLLIFFNLYPIFKKSYFKINVFVLGFLIWLHVPAANFANDHIEDVDNPESYNKQSSLYNLDANAEDLMSLKLNKMRTEGEGRDYSLGEMIDLQSRLMLVTGKADAGRESIERFTSVRILFVIRKLYFLHLFSKIFR